MTLIAVLAVAAFLSPMLRSFMYAIKSTDQISQAGTPVYPADPVTFEYQGEELPILGKPFGFRTLIAAQAAGDFEALKERGRRIVRVTL